MKTLSFWKKSVYSGLVFFGTIMVLSVGYAVWNSTMSQVSSGDSLTATKWNAFVDNINDLNSRWSRVGSDLVFTGGKVGIGTANPTAKLDVQGGRSFFAANNEQYSVGARFTSTGGAVYFGATNNSTTPDAVISAAGGNTLMILQNDGKVGIGIPSPTERLDLGGGNIKMGYEIVSQNGTTPTAGAWATTIATCPTGKQALG